MSVTVRHPSAPRITFRLYLELEPGTLLSVLERLQIAGQSPRHMLFRKNPDDTASTAILDFDYVNQAAAKLLSDGCGRSPA